MKAASSPRAASIRDTSASATSTSRAHDGGGVFATRDAALRAIMEDATGAWLVGAKGEYPLHRPYLHGSDESHPMAVTTAPAGLGTPEDRSRLLAIFLDDKGAQIVSDG